MAVKRLSGGCQEAVRRLSGKNHHNFGAKIKFGRWFRHHRRAYPTPSVLTPAKFDLHFRLSRGCSPSAVDHLVESMGETALWEGAHAGHCGGLSTSGRRVGMYMCSTRITVQEFITMVWAAQGTTNEFKLQGQDLVCDEGEQAQGG